MESAAARLTPSGGWAVNPVFKSGSPGIDDFNALALQCFNLQPTCPTWSNCDRDRWVRRKCPNVQAPAFERDVIQITGQVQHDEAKDRARPQLRRLAARTHPRRAASSRRPLGGTLDAGVFAGLVGVVLVSIYLIAYYRWLSHRHPQPAHLGRPVVDCGCLARGVQGLALTLAGVTGLIVSIGVSVDSNVVYFEHLKEDVRNGRTVRSAVERGLPDRLFHDRQGRRRQLHCCGRAVLADRWASSRVRPLPRVGHGARPDRHLLLYGARHSPHGRPRFRRSSAASAFPTWTGRDEAMDAPNDAATGRRPRRLRPGGAS